MFKSLKFSFKAGLNMDQLLLKQVTPHGQWLPFWTVRLSFFIHM